jgi:hypothetical protein
MSENILVAVRLRPIKSRDFALETTNKVIEITKDKNIHRYGFDFVFGSETSQVELFDKLVAGSIEWVLKGYNTTILAYGPSGSGKSFTIFGTPENRGIVPRACELLFEKLPKDNVVKCSFLEIYRENIRDLFSTSSNVGVFVPSLQIKTNRTKGVYVDGLTEKYVSSSSEVLSFIRDGMAFRVTSPTAINDTSSRSHAIFTLHIVQTLENGTELSSKLNIVDLAGSENVGKSKASGIKLLEAQQINKSLSSLGNVIFALTEKGRAHIPYRDSRLTYLLQDSLGGNSKTIVVANVSDTCSETLNTLKFAQRMKEIKNIPRINQNETNTKLLKTIDTLTTKIKTLEVEATPIVIDATIPFADSMKTFQGKIERLEKKLISVKQGKKEEIREWKLLFNKQKALARNVAHKLERERVFARTLLSEIDRFELYHQSLKECNPLFLNSLLQNFQINRPPHEEVEDLLVEIDSPITEDEW